MIYYYKGTIWSNLCWKRR